VVAPIAIASVDVTTNVGPGDLVSVRSAWRRGLTIVDLPIFDS
jgi:hypothetical protein